MTRLFIYYLCRTQQSLFMLTFDYQADFWLQGWLIILFHNYPKVWRHLVENKHLFDKALSGFTQNVYAQWVHAQFLSVLMVLHCDWAQLVGTYFDDSLTCFLGWMWWERRHRRVFPGPLAFYLPQHISIKSQIKRFLKETFMYLYIHHFFPETKILIPQDRYCCSSHRHEKSDH